MGKETKNDCPPSLPTLDDFMTMGVPETAAKVWDNAIQLLISQRDNARHYADTFRKKLKELGYEYV